MGHNNNMLTLDWKGGGKLIVRVHDLIQAGIDPERMRTAFPVPHPCQVAIQRQITATFPELVVVRSPANDDQLMNI